MEWDVRFQKCPKLAEVEEEFVTHKKIFSGFTQNLKGACGNIQEY